MRYAAPLGLMLLLAGCDPANEGEPTPSESTETGSESTTDDVGQSSAGTTSSGSDGMAPSDDDDDDGDSSSGGDEPNPQDGGTGEDGAPTILSLTLNATVLEEDDSLLVSAIVTDPDGIRDLVGGQLTDDSGDVALGTFATAAAEGAYEVTVPFDVLFELEVEEEGATPVPRLLRATFFDQGGLSVTEMVSVELACSGGFTCGGTACNDSLATCHPIYAPDCPGSETCTRVSAGGGPLNYRCTDAGSAGEGASCSQGGCAAGLFCSDFVCREFCNAAAPCGPGFSCETFDNPPYTCLSDGVCVPA